MGLSENSTTVRPAHGAVLVDSPYAIAPAPGSNSINQIESTRSLPLIIVLCVLVGLSLGSAAWSLSMAFRAQERADLLQLEVESFKNVLHANKLPTSAHLPGELP